MWEAMLIVWIRSRGGKRGSSSRRPGDGGGKRK